MRLFWKLVLQLCAAVSVANCTDFFKINRVHDASAPVSVYMCIVDEKRPEKCTSWNGVVKRLELKSGDALLVNRPREGQQQTYHILQRPSDLSALFGAIAVIPQYGAKGEFSGFKLTPFGNMPPIGFSSVIFVEKGTPFEISTHANNGIGVLDVIFGELGLAQRFFYLEKLELASFMDYQSRLLKELVAHLTDEHGRDLKTFYFNSEAQLRPLEAAAWRTAFGLSPNGGTQYRWTPYGLSIGPPRIMFRGFTSSESFLFVGTAGQRYYIQVAKDGKFSPVASGGKLECVFVPLGGRLVTFKEAAHHPFRRPDAKSFTVCFDSLISPFRVPLGPMPFSGPYELPKMMPASSKFPASARAYRQRVRTPGASTGAMDLSLPRRSPYSRPRDATGSGGSAPRLGAQREIRFDANPAEPPPAAPETQRLPLWQRRGRPLLAVVLPPTGQTPKTRAAPPMAGGPRPSRLPVPPRQSTAGQTTDGSGRRPEPPSDRPSRQPSAAGAARQAPNELFRAWEN